MKDFAKIFKLDGRQVLFFKDTDNENEYFVIRVIINSEKLKAYMQIGAKYKDKEKRDLEFDALDENKAYGFLNSIIELEKECE